MKRTVLLSGAAFIAALVSSPASAVDNYYFGPEAPYLWGQPLPYPKDWDRRIGYDFWTRFVNYYALEWGHADAPPDPSAPPSRRPGWTPQPVSTPPYPYTEWPYGGSTSLGVTRPNSVDSPLMQAMAKTSLGQALNEAHVQVYGWVNFGGNVSTNTVKPGGNWPAAYMYTPNTVQFDQAVVYIERLPDTVQKDHVDWGFRVSGLYGENYRYTTAYGLGSYQLLNHNLVNGYDFPMMYGELYLPWFAEGLMVRFGRFISVPDIEAQLAPNNLMYSHSMAYTFDNYTNTGLQFTQALTKNWFVQFGVTVGTEAMPWHAGKTIPNPFPNPVYPNSTLLVDPGARPSYTGCLRYQTDSAGDNIYVCADAINNGTWGYNNLQWYGLTWYHKFNSQWHLAFEAYTLSQRNVLNKSDPLGIIANNGYPFNPFIIQFNAPNFAQCSDPNVVECTARSIAAVAYLNYKFTPMDNLTFRAEYFHDMQGQRTGVATRYSEFALGWQHWFSPQIEIRPEVGYYKSYNAPAFNGNFNAIPAIAPNKYYMWQFASDLIWHF